jgi:hypothetical protein
LLFSTSFISYKNWPVNSHVTLAITRDLSNNRRVEIQTASEMSIPKLIGHPGGQNSEWNKMTCNHPWQWAGYTLLHLSFRTWYYTLVTIICSQLIRNLERELKHSVTRTSLAGLA